MDNVLSVIAIVISLAAVVFTGLTYRRDGRANRVDNERIDLRWEIDLKRESDSTASLVFKNVGTTEARDAIFNAGRANDGENAYFTFPESFARQVPPGESHSIESHKALLPVKIDSMYSLFEDPHLNWTITCTSRLGTRLFFEKSGTSVLGAP